MLRIIAVLFLVYGVLGLILDFFIILPCLDPCSPLLIQRVLIFSIFYLSARFAVPVQLVAILIAISLMFFSSIGEA